MKHPSATPSAVNAAPLPRIWERLDATRRDLLLLLLVSLPVFFYAIGAWAFFDPDEGRYAEIPREMLERRDFLTPTLNYVLYFEKPPLYYWSVAALMKLLGPSEGAARLASALAALTAVLLVYGLGRRMFGRRAGLLGGLVLATTLFWAVMARQLLLDVQFSTLLFGVLAFWWLGHSDESAPRARLYFVGCWAWLALAVLNKGPVAVILAGAAVLFYVAVCRQPKALRAMEWPLGLLVFMLIAAPWFALIARAHPDFNHFFWYGQNVGRFLGAPGHAEHKQGFSYFFVRLPLLLLPWTPFMLVALIWGWRRVWPARTEAQRGAVFLLGATLLVTLFFSVSSGKLVTYILPIFPPVALLMGGYCDRLLRSRAMWNKPLHVAALLLGALLVLLGGAFLLAGPGQLKRLTVGNPLWALLLGGALLGWGASVLLMTRRRSLPGLLKAVVGGSVVFALCFFSAAPALVPDYAAKSLLDAVRPGLDAGGELIIYDTSSSASLNFYTRRRLRVISNPGEQKFGRAQLPPAQRELWFPHGLAALRRALARPSPVYAVVETPRRAEQLVAEVGGQAVVIVWNRRRAIIGNRAAAALTPPRVLFESVESLGAAPPKAQPGVGAKRRILKPA